MIAAVLIPFLLIFGALGYGWYFQQIENEYKTELEEGRGIALVFETFVKDIHRQEEALGLALMAMDRYSGDVPDHLFLESVNEYQCVESFGFVSPQGWIVSSSDPRAIGTDLADRPYLSQVILTEKTVSNLFQSRLNGTLAFTIARSIRNDSGALQGVVVAIINPARLPLELPLKRFGQGKVSIFDGLGQMVFSADPHIVEIRGIDWSKVDPILVSAINGVEAQGEITSPVDGKKLLAARVPIKSLSWVAGANRPRNEVVDGILRPLRMAALMVAVVLLCSILIALVFTRKITEPILVLEARALALTAQPGAPARPLQGTQELIRLETAFDTMTSQLQSANLTLEHNVEKRTSQLQASNELLLKEIGKRRQMEVELRGMFQYVRSLIETCPDPLVAINHEGKITDVNRASETATGLNRVDMIGTDFSDYFTKPGRAREGYRLALQKGVVKDYALTLQNISGDTMEVLYNAAVYRNAAGEVQGVFAAVRDITKVKDLEEQLRNAEQMKLLAQLTAGVAHEVRNPLNAIMVVAEALFQEIGDNPEYSSYMTHIQNQVRRLSGLMTNLLELGQPIQQDRLTRVDIATLLTGVLTAWQQSTLKDKCVIHRLQPARAKEWHILADLPKIQQVFIHLLENAYEHSPQGGEIHIIICSPLKNYVTLRIVDQGPGISPQNAERVFEPFFTTLQGRIGLGLCFAKHVLALHRGEVTLKNNESAPGLAAEVRLPLAMEENELEIA